MQWPNHDIQPPRKPHGSRIDRRIQRYPPPVSGNAEPSSMYAIAVNMVTTKFRPNARTSEGPVIAKPGPTSRKIVVPIVGPSPIIVISKGPRSRRNLTSTSRPCAIGSRQTESPLLVLGGPADGFQIHEWIVEFRHVPEGADGPRGPDAHRDFEVQQVLRQHAVSIGSTDSHPFAVDPDPHPFDERLHLRRGLDRAFERWRTRRGQGRSDVLMCNRAQLDARLEGGSVPVIPCEVLAGRVVGHVGPRSATMPASA